VTAAADPHRCDEYCTCPIDGSRLLYAPGSGRHACQNPGCEHANGMDAMPYISAANVVGRLRAQQDKRRRLTDPTRLAIIARLVERHGLTQDQAALAVDNASQGIHDDHTALITSAVLGMASEQWAQLIQAMQPIFQTIVQALDTAMKQTARYAEIINPPAVADRPAWQSPHGPPQKGHDRG
jgi:hypothetical protein